MSNVESRKSAITELYNNALSVHVNINTVRPKITVTNGEAVIKGVYANLFRIEERSLGCPRCHSIQYADVLIGKVQILELESA